MRGRNHVMPMSAPRPRLTKIAEKRGRVQTGRKRADVEIFEKFPLHFIPTYPGDEELLRNPLFALLRPHLPSVDKTLGDIMRT